MERLSVMGVLVAVAFLGVIAGAEARAGTWALCTRATFATCVADACAVGVPSRPCCAAVRAPVDGGVPCPCLVAEQPAPAAASRNFSVSRAADLFAACGGGTHLATACAGHAASSRLSERLARLAPPVTTTMWPGCDPGRLAGEISEQCNAGVSSSCCEAVITTVDM